MRFGKGSIAAALAAFLLASATGCGTIQERVKLKKANELYKGQKYEEAIPLYQEVIKINPKSWTGNYLLAMCYLASYHPGSQHEKDLKLLDEGIAQFDKLMTLTPPSKDEMDKVHGFYLSFLNSGERTDKALEFLERQIQEHPENTPLLSQASDLYRKKGDYPKAIEALQRRTAKEPDNKEVWYTIGVVCWARSYHGGFMVSQQEREQLIATGMEALNKAVAIDPEYFEALSYINLLYREQAKALAAVGKNLEAGEAYVKAEEYTKKALEIRKKKQGAPGQAPPPAKT